MEVFVSIKSKLFLLTVAHNWKGIRYYKGHSLLPKSPTFEKWWLKFGHVSIHLYSPVRTPGILFFRMFSGDLRMQEQPLTDWIVRKMMYSTSAPTRRDRKFADFSETLTAHGMI